MSNTKTTTVIIQENGIVLSKKTNHVIGKLLVDYDLIDKAIVPIQKDERSESALLVDKLDELAVQVKRPAPTSDEVDNMILIARVQTHIMDLDLEIKELKRCMEIPRIEDIEEVRRLNKIIDDIFEIAEKRMTDNFGM